MGLLVGGVFDVEPGDLLVPHLYDWSFDGVDDYVEIPHSDALNIVNTITALAWIKRSVSGVSTVVARKMLQYSLQVYSDNKLEFWVSKGGKWYGVRGVAGGVAINANNWYHIAGVYDGAEIRTYVNAVKDRFIALTGSIDSTSNNVNIGRCGPPESSTEYFRGLIGNVLIYNRALSDAEVQQSYSSSVMDASGLVLFLDATFWDGSRFVDLSGNGNHGYPYDGVQRVPAEQRFVLRVKGRFSDGIPRLAVPGRCTFMTNCSWRENWSGSPLFVELQPGRNLVLVETLD